MNDRVEFQMIDTIDSQTVAEFDHLLAAPALAKEASPVPDRIEGVLVGQLVALRDLHEPLVVYQGQPGTGAIAARMTIDLRAEHIGHQVVLVFEYCDPRRPIVTGLLRTADAWSLAEKKPGQVEVDADGERLIVSAREQLVLRCGKAQITLTKAGKVLLEGTYISSRSSGVNRVKGGSIQLN